VKNYKLVVYFHAENDKDAKQQVQAALRKSFDDGHEGMRLTDRNGDRLIFSTALLVESD